MHAVDRTLSIGERAVELMRAYGRSASPQSYELWYTYVTALKPKLNEAVKGLIAQHGKLSPEDIDALYGEHLTVGRHLEDKADSTSSGLLVEIDQVIGLVEAALGSSVRYGDSLASIESDLASPDEQRFRGIMETIVVATREVASSNKQLQGRLRASRDEIDGLRSALEDARAETLTDPLTGMANRKHFESVLTTSIARAHATRSSLMLLVIDIDCFKRFNDTYGHLTGDQVLRLVGAAMRESIEGDATLARFGGEEFAIILPNATPSSALQAAEKIRRNVMGRELLKRSTGESLGRVTISLGVAALQPDDAPATLLGRADACMYEAKRFGRNRTVVDWTGIDRGASTAA